VTATASGVATPASFSLTNTAGPVGSITATTGTPQSAMISTAFATLLQATVRDASNNPVSGVSVTFAAPGAGASGTFTGSPTVSTNSSGIATAPAFTANTTAGSYAVTATAPGVAAPASFSLTNTAGAAASITATAGTPQSATIGTAFATPLQARVSDGFGNPVSGVTVTFAAPGGASASLSNLTGVTNASGVASATATANSSAGSYTVIASMPGQTASFSLTNLATQNVTVQTSPAGLSIQVDSSTYTSPQTFSFVPGSIHTIGVTGTQSGGAGTQYVFANWSDSGSVSHSITASNSAATYTAAFTTQYQLSTSAVPAGSGSVTPASGNFYNAGTTVTLTASANAALRFIRWTGAVASPSSSTTTIVMSGPQSVAATFGQPASPQVTPTSLQLEYFQGTDPASAARILNVNTEDGSRFSVVAADPFVRVSPNTGATPGTVTVTPNPSGLAPGNYSTILTFTFADGSKMPVAVAVRMQGPPQLTVASQPPLNFTAQAGSTGVQSGDIIAVALIRNVTVQVAFTTASGGNWLAVTPGSGSTPVGLHALVNPTGLAAGVYQGSIIVASADASNSPLTIPVTLTITPQPPAISSLVNAASMVQGSGAPNEIATAFGSFPGCTSGAQVQIDDTATTVFFSSPAQVNFLLPARVAGETSISVQISCSGLTPTRVTLPSGNISPAIFTATQKGTGQAAIVNQDGSIAAASQAGTYIQVYVTGFGLLAPPSPDGLARLQLPVTATIGGLPATVQYAGEAPGYTAGLQQINVLVPSRTPLGSAVPLQLMVGGVATQAEVTLAIRDRTNPSENSPVSVVDTGSGND
jgi:uncharacterized protein (TIGR03437 family)